MADGIQKLKINFLFSDSLRLCATGQELAAVIRICFCSLEKSFFGKLNSTIISETRRGFAAMIFVISQAKFSIARLCFCAAIPIIVIAQVAKEVASKSVGENASPRPLLSVGASVIN